jgi:tetratricopeptide (TPR) repeat protein
MSRDVITLQPEVEEILREVAKRPGSALLRVPRKDVARTVLERDTVVHARTAGLSAAERHLVQVYREEVAFALRQAAYALLTIGESTRGFVADRAITPLRAGVPSTGTVRAAASDALSSSRESRSDEDMLPLLECCVSPHVGDWPTSGQLAGAAHRLVPENSSRIYIGLALRGAGQRRAALMALEGVLAGGGPRHHLAVAWTNAGDLLFDLGNYREAWSAADHACALEEGWLVAQGNRALSALLIQDPPRLTKSLDQFERALLAAPGAKAEFAAWYGQRDLLPSATHRSALGQALSTLHSHPHSLAMEVLRAFAV